MWANSGLTVELPVRSVPEGQAEDRVEKRTLALEGQVSEVLRSQRYSDPNYRSVPIAEVKALAFSAPLVRFVAHAK